MTPNSLFRTVRTSPITGAAVVLSVALILGGCGGSSSKTAATSPAPGISVKPGNCADSVVTDHGAKKKPSVVAYAGGDVPDKLVTKDLKVGTGAEAKAGDAVTMQYIGIACSTGVQFDASWDKGTPFNATLAPGNLIDGWIEGVPGMKVGGRRVLVIPPSLGYGPTGQGSDIGPGETLFFVVDLLSTGVAPATTTAAPTTAAPTTAAGPTTTAPPAPGITKGQGNCADSKVTDNGANKKPSVQVLLGGTLPTSLVKQDLKVGTGAEVKDGDNVTMQYIGIACSTGVQFDSSWDRGQPFTAQITSGGLIAGWVQGVPGMKVGGRRVLVIPPALGYGASGQGPDIGPNETLYFVVDVVSIGGSASS